MQSEAPPARRTRRAAAYEERRKQLVAAATVGATVLDLGYAQDPNQHLSGYRVGVDLRRPERPSGYDEEHVADVRSLPGPLGHRRFDTVTCCELIEHLEEPYELLRILRPLVAEGGRLVLTTPNPTGLPVLALEWARDHRRFYTDEHAFYLAPRWVERMLARTGWRTTRVQGVGPWPIPAPWFPAGLSYQVVYVAEPA